MLAKTTLPLRGVSLCLGPLHQAIATNMNGPQNKALNCSLEEGKQSLVRQHDKQVKK